MAVERNRSFFSDGVRLNAVVVGDEHPPGGPPRPAAIYTHGWSGAVNDRVLPLLHLLADHGMLGVAIDHRGFAGSDGPRARCDPQEQARDVGNAVSWVLGRDDVDPARVIVIGASFGGSIAIAAGARDPRVAAVVAMVAVGDAGRWLRALNGPEQWADLQQRLAADAVCRATTGTGERVPFGVLLPTPTQHGADGFDPVAHMYPGGFPLENLELAMNFRPEVLAASIAPRPLVLIGSDDDTVVPIEETLRIHAAAGPTARLVRYPDGDHLGPLGPHVERTATLIRDLAAETRGRADER